MNDFNTVIGLIMFAVIAIVCLFIFWIVFHAARKLFKTLFKVLSILRWVVAAGISYWIFGLIPTVTISALIAGHIALHLLWRYKHPDFEGIDAERHPQHDRTQDPEPSPPLPQNWTGIYWLSAATIVLTVGIIQLFIN